MKRYLLILIFLAVVLISYSQTYPIVWTNPVNVTVNGDNSLTKTVPANAWNAAIVSQNVLLSGQDGYLQFVYDGVISLNYMVSLSRFNNDPVYSTSDYSLYCSNGYLYLYNEGGILVSSIAIVAGDILKISREGNSIKYYKNATVLYTLALTTNTDFLRADISIGNGTGSVPVIVASFRPALMVEPQFQFPGISNNNGSITLTTEGQNSICIGL